MSSDHSTSQFPIGAAAAIDAWYRGSARWQPRR